MQSAVYTCPIRVRFSESRILKNIEEVLRFKDISLLSELAYCFITQHCGSAAATPQIWKERHSDLRDFINLFLTGNELGQDISAGVGEKGSPRNGIWRIKRGIVDLCKRYKSEVFSELDRKERNLSRQIAHGLLNGNLRLEHISENYSASSLSNAASSNPERTATTREIVDALNELAEKYEYKKIRAIFNAFPIETIAAGNYVNTKYRYAVQAVIANALVESTR